MSENKDKFFGELLQPGNGSGQMTVLAVYVMCLFLMTVPTICWTIVLLLGLAVRAVHWYVFKRDTLCTVMAFLIVIITSIILVTQ